MNHYTNPNAELDLLAQERARLHHDAERARAARAAAPGGQRDHRAGRRVALGVLLAAGAIVIAPPVFTGSADEVPPSGCSRPDGSYDFGCRAATGRPDGWFEPTAPESRVARVVPAPGNLARLASSAVANTDAQIDPPPWQHCAYRDHPVAADVGAILRVNLVPPPEVQAAMRGELAVGTDCSLHDLAV